MTKATVPILETRQLIVDSIYGATGEVISVPSSLQGPSLRRKESTGTIELGS